LENILKNNNFNTNLNSIINETIASSNTKNNKEETKKELNNLFFNETKMRQKLKKDWIQISNKYQSEIDLEFIDNSIDILQDSKYYLNSSNILPFIEFNNNHNTNNDKLPIISNKENFFQSQINMNSYYHEKINNRNINNKNSSQINFVESNNNFYIRNNKKNNGESQKLNFNSIYQYNLKSENDLVEKIRNRDRENYLNINQNQNNLNLNNNNQNSRSNNKCITFNDTAYNPNNNNNSNKIKNNTLYLANNNPNQNDITYINIQNNNSAGFKMNSSGEIQYINASLANIKLDLYDLGQLLIYSILGGFDIISFTHYECFHTRSDNCCCLLHCYFKYEAQNKKENKFKLKDLFKKLNLSHNLESFICSLTSYKLERSLSIEYLKEHLWLSDVNHINSNNNNRNKDKQNNTNYNENYNSKNNNDYVNNYLLVDFDELFKLANELNNKGSIINNGQNSKKFEKFFESYSIILPKSTKYFKHYNIKSLSQINNKNANIDYISKEINIDKNFLVGKLKAIFDNFFKQNPSN